MALKFDTDKLKSKPKRSLGTPPVDVTSENLKTPELAPGATDEALVVPDVEAPKRGKGRPKSAIERKVFATRLTPEEIQDVQAMTDGLRLRMQGELIGRALAHYKAHLIGTVKQNLDDQARDQSDDDLLAQAYRFDSN